MPHPTTTRHPPLTAHGSAAATHGAALTFETVEASGPLRVRPDEVTLLRVIAGTVRLRAGAVERLLATGQEAVIGAGQPHRVLGAGGPARVVTGFRASLP